MTTNHILLGFLWIVYCLIHSVLADLAVKEKIKKIIAGFYKYYRFGYNIFAFVSFAPILWYAISMSSFLLWQPNLLLIIIGSIVGLSGSIIMIACILKYLPNLSGVKNISTKNFTSQLIVSGLHRYTRHPLYLGTFLFLWGLFIMFPYLSFFISNIIITIYTLIGIKIEEKKLELEFGDSYRQYKQKVPKLFPIIRSPILKI